MKQFIGKMIQNMGYEVVNRKKMKTLPPDFESLHRDIYGKVKDNTMTSPERIFSLIEAVRYIEKNKIPGAMVECGVWKGGSMMAVAETLQYLNNKNRELFLYDTYDGMSEPTQHDKTYSGDDAGMLLKTNANKEKSAVWAYSALETVEQNMRLTGYPADKITYVKGKVEDTIPKTMPQKIALLRLDTDWYESTQHELLHLFPLLENGGVLILDDYGHWAGAKKAIDEFIAAYPSPILLNRIDETGRIAVKQA